MAEAVKQVRDEQAQRNGLIGEVVVFAINFLVVMVIALLTSVLIEWAGMVFLWWDEDGAGHSQRTLLTEIEFIANDFNKSLTASTPSELTIAVANKTYRSVAVDSGLNELRAYLDLPPSVKDSTVIGYARSAYLFFKDYIQSAITIVQLFAVRCAIIGLSIPLFVLIIFAAFIDGLVQRELRKAGGGREYGLVYHHIKSWFKPVLFLPVFVYLASPWPTHPNWIFAPSALVIGILVFMLSATFKKYL